MTSLRVGKSYSRKSPRTHVNRMKHLTSQVEEIDRRLNTLINSVNASQRPYVTCQLLNEKVKLLYDSGADISIVANEVFQKAMKQIPPHLRPKRIKIRLKAKSANGGRIDIRGCYLTPISVHGKRIIHPIFVGSLRSNGLLGIDVINRLKLSYDARSKSTYR